MIKQTVNRRVAPRDRAIVTKLVPSRSELLQAEIVREGLPLKADLLLLDFEGHKILVKDYRNKPWWARLLGRIQVSREYRGYRWLGTMPGIPALIGRVDVHAVAVEWVDGELLAHAPNRIDEGVTHVSGLREVMERMHSTGLVHLDLRSNKNVLLRRDGAIVVVDFASSVCLRPGGLAFRLFFPWLSANDRSGWVKWKQTLAAGELSDAERSLVRRHDRFRRFWIFNPKRRRSGRS